MSISRRSFLTGVGATTAEFILRQREPLSNFATQSLPPLVFIPGIKGSVLSDAKAAVRWFTLLEGLGLESPDLRLPLKWHGKVQERDGLVATAPLSSVGWHEVYAPFLKWAEASGRVFRAFAYDWRRDNLESTDELVAFLENVSRESGSARIQVVAHSMGGLITFVALTRRPDLFHSILFAGVPFGPSINFLEDMHSGTSNGLNKRILNPQVLFTFVSPYSLFSPDPQESGLLDTAGNGIAHDWFSSEDWGREKLGLFADSGIEGITTGQREHLNNALDRAREFRSMLVYSHSVRYPPMAVLAGNTRPTLHWGIRNGPRAVKGWDFETAPKLPGDERVHFEGAVPPGGVPHRVFKSSQTHEELLNNTGQVQSVLTHLLSE
jgi:pimeloyl-ACP methyl ester carboxylesterase